MKITYTFTVEVPESFLKWLKENGFKKVRGTFSWKRIHSTYISCEYLMIRVVPTHNGFYVMFEWWGDNGKGEIECYDSLSYPTFQELTEDKQIDLS